MRKNSIKTKLNALVRVAVIAIFTTVSLYSVGHAGAAADAQLYLGPTSQAVNTGSTVTLTVNMSATGNSVFAWQTYLTYPTSYFDSASVSTSSGSPFTMSAGNDVASNGVISLTRFATSSHAYDGAVAVITLHSNGNAGTASATMQHICANSSESINCSAIVNGSGSNVLGSIAGSSVTLNAPASSGGSSSSSSSGGTAPKKTSKSSTKAATTTATAAVAQPTTKPDTTKATSTEVVGDQIELIITVRDQSGKPVQHAQVTVNGVTAYTDKDGKAVLTGVSPSASKAVIKYKGQEKELPLQLQPASEQASQTAQVSIEVKKASAVLPLSIGAVILLPVIVGVMFFISHRRGPKSLKTPKNMAPSRSFDDDAHFSAPPKPLPTPTPVAPPKPVAPVVPAPAPKPVTPQPSPFVNSLEITRQSPPKEAHQEVTKPEQKHIPEAARLARQRALEPGTIVHPSELEPRSSW